MNKNVEMKQLSNDKRRKYLLDEKWLSQLS